MQYTIFNHIFFYINIEFNIIIMIIITLSISASLYYNNNIFYKLHVAMLFYPITTSSLTESLAELIAQQMIELISGLMVNYYIFRTVYPNCFVI